MFKPLRKLKQLICSLFFFQLWFWTLMAVVGCGGSANIPSAAILTSARVTLGWNNVPGAAAYNVYLSKSPGITVLNSNKISNATNPITIIDLQPGTTYYFLVAVEDDSGQSPRSKEIAYTTSNTEGFIEFGDILSNSTADALVSKSKTLARASTLDTEGSAAKPEQQRRQIAAAGAMVSTEQTTAVAEGEDAETRDVFLSWDEVPNATSYNIYWSDKQGVTKRNGTKISNVKNPHKITGLIKGKKYYFVVTAVNASGESKESEELSFAVGH